MAQTDKDGRFTIQELPGEYTLQPALEDYVGIQIRLSREEYPEWFEQKVILSRIGADCSDTVRLQVLFETAKYDLTSASVAALDEFVALIDQHKVNGGEVKLLAMEGHTDEHGGIEDNMTLSMHRVNTVRDYLASKLPAIASRITSTWYGNHGLSDRMLLRAHHKKPHRSMPSIAASSALSNSNFVRTAKAAPSHPASITGRSFRRWGNR